MNIHFYIHLVQKLYNKSVTWFSFDVKLTKLVVSFVCNTSPSRSNYFNQTLLHHSYILHLLFFSFLFLISIFFSRSFHFLNSLAISSEEIINLAPLQTQICDFNPILHFTDCFTFSDNKSSNEIFLLRVNVWEAV